MPCSFPQAVEAMLPMLPIFSLSPIMREVLPLEALKVDEGGTVLKARIVRYAGVAGLYNSWSWGHCFRCSMVSFNKDGYIY